MGKGNPKLTRLILVATHTLLAMSAIALGMLLFIQNWEAPKVLLYAIATLFFISFIAYPIKKSSFRRWKINDFCLAFLYALLIMVGENNALVNYQNKNSAPQFNATAQFVVLHENNGAQTGKAQKRIAKEKRKNIRKRIKNELIKARKDNSMPMGVIALLIVLTILVSIILLWLNAALACTIACNGSPGFAWIVGILGTGGIITGTVFFIIRLLRRGRGVTLPDNHEELPDTIDVPF